MQQLGTYGANSKQLKATLIFSQLQQKEFRPHKINFNTDFYFFPLLFLFSQSLYDFNFEIWVKKNNLKHSDTVYLIKMWKKNCVKWYFHRFCGISSSNIKYFKPDLE